MDFSRAKSVQALANRRRMAVGACVLAVCAACAGGPWREDPATPATATLATPTPSCAACDIDPTRHLRQISLDLRGAPPSIEELNDVVRENGVSPERIEAMLHTAQFLGQVRDWHKPLLWPNVDNFLIGVTPLAGWESLPDGSVQRIPPYPQLVVEGPAKHPRAVLSAGFPWTDEQRGRARACDDQVEYPAPAERGPQPTYTVTGTDGKPHTHPFYDTRGVPLPYHTATDCPNFCSSKSDVDRRAHHYDAFTIYRAMDAPGADPSPDELDPPGTHCPAAFPYRVVNACGNGAKIAESTPTRQREGFRWATHYWSHGERLKTCAFEAQTRTASAISGAPCARGPDVSCGCGPDGIYCMPSRATWDTPNQHALRSAIDEEPLEIVADVVGRDDDYFEAFTTRRSFVTGPLAFFFRHQTTGARPFEISPPAPPDELPDVPYDDDAWHEYVRGPQHSGVLTTTEYLVRFPTRRSRIAQFRAEFMCRPISPIVDATPGPDDACTLEPNLAKRCGCRNCHSVLEPMTAWFGRWSERSAKYLDPALFPPFDPGCRARCEVKGTFCSQRCSEYVSEATDADGASYVGTLRGYLYRTPEEEKRIDEGPRGLVDAAIASGELESCTVRTLWKQLLGREMTGDEQRVRLPQLESDFDQHGRSYRALVRAIVTAPEDAHIGGSESDVPGRAPRRLSVDQLRASLVATTGFGWVARHNVADPDSPYGFRNRKDADMLEVLAATLGEADYKTNVSDALDPAITFTKLAGDAARSACRASIAADVSAGSESRRILRFVSPTDTLASNRAAVRKNLSYLALRFWGRSLADDDAELDPLAQLFERATQAATPADGWRAVCIGLATDPQFLTY